MSIEVSSPSWSGTWIAAFTARAKGLNFPCQLVQEMVQPHKFDSVVILFDGVCTLCNRTVDFIIRHDRAHRFRYGSLQSSSGRALLEEFNLSKNNLDSIVVIDQGRIYRKSEAALRIARDLDAPWRFVTVLRVLPRCLRDGLYDWIARHRYAWFGKKETCRIPTEAERQLFLE